MRISDWSSDVCSSDLFLFPMRGWKDALLEYTAASVEVLVPHEGLEGTVGPRPGRQQLVLVPHEGLEANAASPAGAAGTPGVLVPHEGLEVRALSRGSAAPGAECLFHMRGWKVAGRVGELGKIVCIVSQGGVEGGEEEG